MEYGLLYICDNFENRQYSVIVVDTLGKIMGKTWENFVFSKQIPFFLKMGELLQGILKASFFQYVLISDGNSPKRHNTL